MKSFEFLVFNVVFWRISILAVSIFAANHEFWNGHILPSPYTPI